MKRKREEQPRAEPESWFSEEEQAADRAEAARERRRHGGREPSPVTAYWRVPVACMAEDVRLYVERGVPQGSFLTALFSNDLTAAFQCADAPRNSQRILESLLRDCRRWGDGAARCCPSA